MHAPGLQQTAARRQFELNIRLRGMTALHVDRVRQQSSEHEVRYQNSDLLARSCEGHGAVEDSGFKSA